MKAKVGPRPVQLRRESPATGFPISTSSATSGISGRSRSGRSCRTRFCSSAKPSPATWWWSRRCKSLRSFSRTKRLRCCRSTFISWSGKKIIPWSKNKCLGITFRWLRFGLFTKIFKEGLKLWHSGREHASWSGSRGFVSCRVLGFFFFFPFLFIFH